MQALIQNQVITALEKKGFRFNAWTSEQDEAERSALLSRRDPKRRFSTQLAQVDPDGSVNGKSLADYLKWLKACN